MASLTDPETRPNAPVSERRTLKKARLLEQIAAAAGELFQARGYMEVTMEQIAAAAEVSKRTLYKYFPVKEAILAHLLEGELARDLASHPGFQLDLDAPFRANVSALLVESAGWCERHPDYLLPYIRYKFASFEPNAETDGKGDLVQTWSLLIAAAQQRGELDPSQPAERLAIYFHYLYLGALMRWITDRRLDLKQEFTAVVRLFVDGARAPGRR
ncbi:TetR/AcrR family transcriptional regulator [Massilia agilis]|uniref:TetR/AcrR family transcriptional regulator n=1 Tax=Massilia agilis TaxID=1811226 RepID=A0ABT2DF14_9BURK|nr:TetR/AcrR family transcriptional regulator [Massilia agilis]MCS0809911.1 TetR/AcrR family transcriptional regulator [Massilia agilis]